MAIRRELWQAVAGKYGMALFARATEATRARTTGMHPGRHRSPGTGATRGPLTSGPASDEGRRITEGGKSADHPTLPTTPPVRLVPARRGDAGRDLHGEAIDGGRRWHTAPARRRVRRGLRSFRPPPPSAGHGPGDQCGGGEIRTSTAAPAPDVRNRHADHLRRARIARWHRSHAYARGGKPGGTLPWASQTGALDGYAPSIAIRIAVSR